LADFSTGGKSRKTLGLKFSLLQARNQRLIWNLQTPEARMSHDAIRATGVILSEWDTLNEYYSISDEARLKLIWATSLAHF